MSPKNKVSIAAIKNLSLLILLWSGADCYTQTTLHPNITVYTTTSADESHYLVSIPYENIEQEHFGETFVYDKDSSLQYIIPRNFEVSPNKYELFLSNDGSVAAYIVNTEFQRGDIINSSIQLYKNGIAWKQYRLSELIECDSNVTDCTLFYNDLIDHIEWRTTKDTVWKRDVTRFERSITKQPVYRTDDTVIIFAKTGKVLSLGLLSGEITMHPINDFKTEQFSSLQVGHYDRVIKKTPPVYGVPPFVDGQSFEEALADYLDMKKVKDKEKRVHVNRAFISVLINNSGKASLHKIEHSNLDEKKVSAFIEQAAFDASSLKGLTDRWVFTGWVDLRNKSLKAAKREWREQEERYNEIRKANMTADSINGLYIPKNIEDCFAELNRILKPKDISVIKAYPSRDDTIELHHGLGMWLRNNWGLWGGSRLQTYMLERGIDHPDSMSGIILEYYYDWLNNSHGEWKKFDAK